MKAISLWQPWASAVALGSKRIDTRSWSTGYRGPLLIHAAKRMVKAEMIDFACRWGWRAALHLSGDGFLWDCLPFGALIAVCMLTDCKPTADFTNGELDYGRYGWTERELGDFSLGRYGWVLANVEAFRSPIPYRGFQGLFDVPDQYVETRL